MFSRRRVGRYDKLTMTTLSASDIADVGHGKSLVPRRVTQLNRIEPYSIV